MRRRYASTSVREVSEPLRIFCRICAIVISSNSKLAGVNLDAQDAQGRTAAHGAAMWGYTDVIKFLAKNGADLTIKDKRGLTPLDAAMGLAGGLGFDGKSGTVREDTAKAIRELLGDKAEFDPNKKPVGSPRADDPANRSQTQDLPN